MEMVPDVIEIPRSHPAVAPLLSILPLQLLAYHIAVARGCGSVDSRLAPTPRALVRARGSHCVAVDQ